MLLKRMEILNFRQFLGKQFIKFATDQEKNVTIIMGSNGSGKTTLAQAFTWCLYGKTDFDDPILLSKSISKNMLPAKEESVKVKLEFEHAKIDYTVTSEQKYSKSYDNTLKPLGQRNFSISYKNKDGQTEFVSDVQTEYRIRDILPPELSKYFFFDGERINNMSKELKRGKSQEFAEAVKSLLGLSAFTSAMNHLKGRGNSKSVIRSYDDQYDSSSDKRIADYTHQINEKKTNLEYLITNLELNKTDIDNTENYIRKLNEQIYEHDFSKQKTELLLFSKENIGKYENFSNSLKKDVIKLFNRHGYHFFLKKLIFDSLKLLHASQHIDKGVPDIHSRTIDFIIKRHKCICGTEVRVGEDSFNNLNKLRDFIPPQSLGNLIEQFRLSCETNIKQIDTFKEEIDGKYSDFLINENNIIEELEKINRLTEELKKLPDVGKIQSQVNALETNKMKLDEIREQMLKNIGEIEPELSRLEAERNKLSLSDKNNTKIEKFKAYAIYLHDQLHEQYLKEEEIIRHQLSITIDEIFKSIYDGGFSLRLDDKYNIQVLMNDDLDNYEDIETSTAQTISIIFAFISGVIKLARSSQKLDIDLNQSEVYPLVMDAPLSAFDKSRIQTVSSVLPKIAEQVIIFIKDTDGEIAEKYLNHKIGSYMKFRKNNEIETYIEERG